MDAQKRMTIEDRGEDRRPAIFSGRHEEAEAPSDDLRIQAKRLQLRNSAVGETGELDAPGLHHQ